MTAGRRLRSAERRADIVRAVREVFAKGGFHGTTTKELARAAGVSEALLFKHFPDKESLFLAMQDDCCREYSRRYESLEALDPSASTLVLLVHFLVALIITDKGDPNFKMAADRLVLRSLAEDGAFARHLHRLLSAGWLPKVEECVRAATAAGEAIADPVSPALGGWFIHNLAALIRFQGLPSPAVVDYGVKPDTLVEQAVRFSLRGLGVTDEAIRRYYNPKALALLT